MLDPSTRDTMLEYGLCSQPTRTDRARASSSVVATMHQKVNYKA